MILLLDAHTVLWWLADDPTLDPAARSAIADPPNDVLVSAASIWEIEIKRALGKLVAPGRPAGGRRRGRFRCTADQRAGRGAGWIAARPTIAIRSIGCSSRRRIGSARSW